MGVRSRQADGGGAQRRDRAVRYQFGDHRPGGTRWERRSYRRRPGTAAEPEGEAARRRIMLNFNLSEWAITNRPVVWFMVIVVVVTGAWSYLGLGRNEDPPFTVKAMVVQAQWPGATMEDTLQQVTERIEKK